MAARKTPKKPKTAGKTSKPRKTAAKAKKPAAKTKAEAGVTVQAVNRGHLFTLRPRVSTAFRPEDFQTAKRELADETYPSIEAAARAVAERALALSNEPRGKHDFAPSR